MKGTMGIRLRRESAKILLEAELARGTKPEKINGKTTSKMISLTPGDITRIKKELDTINNPKKKKLES
jgi:hypothetical protein